MTILLVIHMMLAAAIVGLVLLQRSEGGALGIGGSAGGMGGLMAGRAAANLLTRATAITAAFFFATSILLSILSGGTHDTRSILDAPPPANIPFVDQRPVDAPADTPTDAPADGADDGAVDQPTGPTPTVPLDE